MDNYAVINGKRVELTDEQVKAMGIETRKNPFARVEEGCNYYRIAQTGRVGSFEENFDVIDNSIYEAANYFNDESFAEQVALHQLLYRKLLKFAYGIGCEDTEWDGANDHWRILYCKNDDDFGVLNMKAVKDLTVYFSTKEGASRAINEVIRPFMKEHPDFVW